MEPVSPSAVTPLARRYGKLVQELGLEPGEPLLVLPNGDFFPDLFKGDQASVERLVARLSGYAGLEATEVGARLLGAELGTDCGPSGCGTGACGTGGASSGEGRLRILREGDGFLLDVPAKLLADPIVLTARLATALSSIVLHERHPSGEDAASDPELAEATAVALGFGVLLLEASYIYRKSCGGPQVGCGTTLDVSSLSVLTCLFLAREGLKPASVRGELGTTQRAVLAEIWALIERSPSLVEGLKRDPARVATGRFTVGDGGSFFTRWFGRGRSRVRSNEDAALAALERGASVDELEALLGADSGRRR